MNEKKQSNRQALVLAHRDRAMEGLKKNKHQLKTIIRFGPRCRKDVTLVRECLCFCMGEIRRQEREFADYQSER